MILSGGSPENDLNHLEVCMSVDLQVDLRRRCMMQGEVVRNDLALVPWQCLQQVDHTSWTALV
jgi:hypothetical protein